MFMMPVRMSRSKPAITLVTIIKIATPKSGPRTDRSEMMETKVRFGRKYLSARKMSSGKRKMEGIVGGSAFGENIMRGNESAPALSAFGSERTHPRGEFPGIEVHVVRTERG